jgi:hypothetical protein
VKTIAFFGGSNLIGVGYPDGIISKDIYPNIIASQGYNIKNYGIAGGSGYEIFLACLHQLAQSTPDIVFIEWNMLVRHRFHPSPEVSLSFSASETTLPDNWSHCIPVPNKQLENFKKTLLLLDGDYHRILTLLTYCEIIQDICKLKNIELVMIPSSIPWSEDLFVPYSDKSDLSLCLSNYSKELLDFDNRDDSEILSLLSQLRQQFNLLDLEKWVWIFESIPMLTVDRAPLDRHPGPNTMKIIATRILAFLKEKNI